MSVAWDAERAAQVVSRIAAARVGALRQVGKAPPCWLAQFLTVFYFLRLGCSIEVAADLMTRTLGEEFSYDPKIDVFERRGA